MYSPMMPRLKSWMPLKQHGGNNGEVSGYGHAVCQNMNKGRYNINHRQKQYQNTGEKAHPQGLVVEGDDTVHSVVEQIAE